MSMLNPKAKRRRLDDGASALSRPFKSPLRKEHTTAPTNRNKGGEYATPSNAASSSNRIIKPSTSPFQNSKVSRLQQQTSHQLHPGSDESEVDAEIATLRRKRLALQAQLASLRSELETAQQALRIESSRRDEELKSLIGKWRGVSQRAAEELFEAAKDKVERMGGVAAWKEGERERLRRMQMWEDEDFYDGVGDASECDGANNRDDEGVTATLAGKKAERKNAGDEEKFSIGMMLKSLNIEPETIGFDEVEERWVNSHN